MRVRCRGPPFSSIPHDRASYNGGTTTDRRRRRPMRHRSTPATAALSVAAIAAAPVHAECTSAARDRLTVARPPATPPHSSTRSAEPNGGADLPRSRRSPPRPARPVTSPTTSPSSPTPRRRAASRSRSPRGGPAPRGRSVTFTDKLNTVRSIGSPAASADRRSERRRPRCRQLARPASARSRSSVTRVRCRPGRRCSPPIRRTASRTPSPGKQYRLDVQRYELYHHGTEA